MSSATARTRSWLRRIQAWEPGPVSRVAVAVVYLGLAVAVLLTLGQRAAPKGVQIVALELAGSAARAEAVLGDAVVADVRMAIALDFAFILGYGGLLALGCWFFAPRAYRLSSFRRFRGVALVLTVVAMVLDGVENAGMLVGLGVGQDLPWQVAATASWAKWAILVLVVGYTVVALGTFVTTPSWVAVLLRDPEIKPNVCFTAEEARIPAGKVVSGTPDTAGAEQIGPARFGIAASGGGIRSASLVLGSLQGLDRAYPDAASPGPSWATADKVTSVSGGSYIAGGFSVARSARRQEPPSAAPAPHADAWSADGPDGGSPEQKHLLGQLGYLLAPNPSGRTGRRSDVPGVVAMVAVGLALNAAVLFSLLWTVIQPYAWLLKSDVIGCRSPEDCRIQPHLVVPVVFWGTAAAALLLLWVASGWVRGALASGTGRFKAAHWLNTRLRPAVFWLAVLTATLAVLLIAVPALVVALPGWFEKGRSLLTPAAVASAIGSLAALGRGLSGRRVRFAPYVAATLFVAAVVLVSVQWLIDADYGRTAVLRLGVVVAVWVVGYTFVSAEWWSIAGFYRGRLRLAFATYRDAQGRTAKAFRSGNWPAAEAEPSIYELLERRPGRPAGSPLTICTTAHASTPDVRTHYGLPAMSVTISPDTVRLHTPTDDEGGWAAHQASTGLVEKLLFRRAAPRLTTMLAVGLSGAAVSPAMGLYRIGPARMLLAVANVRLGMWIPNPRYAAHLEHTPDGRRPDRPHSGVPYPRPRLSYLLKEFFGLHDPHDLYLYLTDGGHWENTGLVELIRDRTIDEVVCLDADEKPRHTATEVAAAIGLAKLECGADIDLDLDVLRGPWDGRRGTDYSPQSVALGVIRRGTHIGLLWYAKPVLTRDTPLGLLSYAECDDTFPITSTVDQFFHTAQFKAYRDLGRHNAAVLVQARTTLAAATDRHPTYDAFCTAARAEGTHWAVTSLARLKLSQAEYDRLRASLNRGSTFGDPGAAPPGSPGADHPATGDDGEAPA